MHRFEGIDALVKDLEESATAHFAGCGGEEGANGLGGSAIFTDDLTDVLAGHAKLDAGNAVAHVLSHDDAFGVVDKRGRDERNELCKGGEIVSHGLCYEAEASGAALTLASRRSLATVAEGCAPTESQCCTRPG